MIWWFQLYCIHIQTLLSLKIVCTKACIPCYWTLSRYDGHILDPLASLQFTTGTYYMLAANIKQLAKELCGGRCVFFLEGGYNLKSLSYSVADSFRAFLGESSVASKFDNPAILFEEPTAKVKQAIQRVKHIHSLWGFRNPQLNLSCKSFP